MLCIREVSLLRLEGLAFERPLCAVSALLVDGPALDVVFPVLLLKGTPTLERSLVVVATLLLEEEALPPNTALLVEERRYSCEYSYVC